MEFIEIIFDFITGIINLIITAIQYIIEYPILIPFIIIAFAKAWLLKHS